MPGHPPFCRVSVLPTQAARSRCILDREVADNTFTAIDITFRHPQGSNSPRVTAETRRKYRSSIKSHLSNLP